MLALGARAPAAEATPRSRRTGPSAVPASVSWSILCHTCYQHTQSAVPEPVIRPWRPSPLTLALSPRSPPGGRVGVRPLCASGSHRPVGPGLPCSPLSPLWLSSPCLSPRRVRLLSSQPLCWRPTPHTHADPVLTRDPSVPHPPASVLPTHPACSSLKTCPPGLLSALAFPSGLLISAKMSPPLQGQDRKSVV